MMTTAMLRGVESQRVRTLTWTGSDACFGGCISLSVMPVMTAPADRSRLATPTETSTLQIETEGAQATYYLQCQQVAATQCCVVSSRVHMSASRQCPWTAKEPVEEPEVEGEDEGGGGEDASGGSGEVR
eukprot:37625-Rhodomonas_salina.1